MAIFVEQFKTYIMKRFRSINRQLKRGNLKTVLNLVAKKMDLFRKTNAGKWILY